MDAQPEGIRPGSDALASLREIATDSLRYWEPRRLLYNAVLAVVVIGCFVATGPTARQPVSVDLLSRFFLLAVIANVFYCAAYVVDVFVQLSMARATWRRRRWVLLLVGILFATTIARFISLNVFAEKAEAEREHARESR